MMRMSLLPEKMGGAATVNDHMLLNLFCLTTATTKKVIPIKDILIDDTQLKQDVLKH